jgi:branched-subunit amino acid aminotransferase/4-amino-4-deoxychorismate lyase
VLFRPNANASRMREGAARMLMPSPPAELFIRAVREVVNANQARYHDIIRHYSYVPKCRSLQAARWRAGAGPTAPQSCCRVS